MSGFVPAGECRETRHAVRERFGFSGFATLLHCRAAVTASCRAPLALCDRCPSSFGFTPSPKSAFLCLTATRTHFLAVSIFLPGFQKGSSGFLLCSFQQAAVSSRQAGMRKNVGLQKRGDGCRMATEPPLDPVCAGGQGQCPPIRKMDVRCDVGRHRELVGDRVPFIPPAALNASHRRIVNGLGVP